MQTRIVYDWWCDQHAGGAAGVVMVCGATALQEKIPAANLTNADLSTASLQVANLTRAYLTDANFTRAILDGVIGYEP